MSTSAATVSPTIDWSTPIKGKADRSSLTKVRVIHGPKATLDAAFDPNGDHSHSRPGDAGPNAKEAVLGSWEKATFPTWSFWGTTRAHIYNTGNCGLVFTVQAGAAQPTSYYLDPGEDVGIEGQWAAFPVTFTNEEQRDEANGVWPFMSVWVW